VIDGAAATGGWTTSGVVLILELQTLPTVCKATGGDHEYIRTEVQRDPMQRDPSGLQKKRDSQLYRSIDAVCKILNLVASAIIVKCRQNLIHCQTIRMNNPLWNGT
jgi:hypothetical protein